MSIQSARQSVVNAIGARAIHAVEDGLTVGVLVGFGVTVPMIAGAFAAILTGVPRTAGILSLLREIPEIVRGEDVRAQESYFILAVLAGVALAVPVGYGLSLLAPVL